MSKVKERRRVKLSRWEIQYRESSPSSRGVCELSEYKAWSMIERVWEWYRARAVCVCVVCVCVCVCECVSPQNVYLSYFKFLKVYTSSVTENRLMIWLLIHILEAYITEIGSIDIGSIDIGSVGLGSTIILIQFLHKKVL